MKVTLLKQFTVKWSTFLLSSLKSSKKVDFSYDIFHILSFLDPDFSQKTPQFTFFSTETSFSIKCDKNLVKLEHLSM